MTSFGAQPLNRLLMSASDGGLFHPKGVCIRLETSSPSSVLCALQHPEIAIPTAATTQVCDETRVQLPFVSGNNPSKSRPTIVRARTRSSRRLFLPRLRIRGWIAYMGHRGQVKASPRDGVGPSLPAPRRLLSLQFEAARDKRTVRRAATRRMVNYGTHIPPREQRSHELLFVHRPNHRPLSARTLTLQNPFEFVSYPHVARSRAQ